MASTAIHHRSYSSSDVCDYDLLDRQPELPSPRLSPCFFGLFFCSKFIHWLFFFEFDATTIHDLERVQLGPYISGISHDWPVDIPVTGDD